MKLKSLNYAFLALALGVFASCGSGVSPASSDATLDAALSTVKGVALDSTGNSLGTPGATSDYNSIVLGEISVSTGRSLDTTNSGNYITAFVPTNSGSITKVVKYVDGAAAIDGDFENDTPYNNEALAEGNLFVVKVTAPDGTILYYGMIVSIVLGTDATLSTTSSIKGFALDGLAGSLGTGATTVAGLANPGAVGLVTISETASQDPTGSTPYLTGFFPADTFATTTKVVQFIKGAVISNDSFNLALPYNYSGPTSVITNDDIFVVKVTAEDNTTVRYYGLAVTVTPGPSHDARLKSSSTIKGETLEEEGLGTLKETFNDVKSSLDGGVITISYSKSINQTNETSFITEFIRSDQNATVTQVVKYSSAGLSSANESAFNAATTYAYSGAASVITSGSIFVVKVTAEDGTTVGFYKITVTVTAASTDATLATSSTIKGKGLGDSGLGILQSTFTAIQSSETGGTITLPYAKSIDDTNETSFITEFVRSNSGATITQVVKYSGVASLNSASESTFNAATTYAYSGPTSTITTGNIFVVKVTAEDDTTVKFYKITASVTPRSTDATLSATSTLKGVMLTGASAAKIGTPKASISALVADPSAVGAITLTVAQANNETDFGNFVTDFIKTNSLATVSKVVQYPMSSQPFSDFDTASIYMNQAINDITGKVFIIKVTAEDPAYVLYYAIMVTVVDIGSAYQGGQIAYFCVSADTSCYSESTRQPHGLIVSMENVSTGSQWGCSGILISGTSPAFGRGPTNTGAITAACADFGIAAKLCYEYINPDAGFGVYSDWYLPSRDELTVINANKSALNFSPFAYWSSSQSGALFAYARGFDVISNSSTMIKAMNPYVRAVRSF